MRLSIHPTDSWDQGYKNKKEQRVSTKYGMPQKKCWMFYFLRRLTPFSSMGAGNDETKDMLLIKSFLLLLTIAIEYNKIML